MKIKLPNLPQGRVNLVAVGEEYPEIISSLQNLGINVVLVPKNDALPACECSHADMRLFHLGDDRIVAYKEDFELVKRLEKLGFAVQKAESEFNGKYPQSVSLNALRIGNILLCKRASLDASILSYAEQNSLEIIDCRQGYSKCATCIVCEKAAITADISVYNALKDKIDVLLIKTGHIRLGDRDEGMIGGAAFLIDEKTLAFCGDVTAHPDYEKIEKFLKKYNISYLCLTNQKLLDVGSVLPLETAKKV